MTEEITYYNTTEERVRAAMVGSGQPEPCDYDLHIYGEMATEITENDFSEAEAHPLALSHKGHDLAWRALQTARHNWTLLSLCGGDSQWWEAPADLTSPPQSKDKPHRFIDYSLAPKLKNSSSLARLYAVSLKFGKAFALRDVEQWTEVAHKAVVVGGCDAHLLNQMTEDALCGYGSLDGTGDPDTGCRGENTRLATVYEVKFGEFISVVAVCDRCATALEQPYGGSPSPAAPLSETSQWAQIIHFNFGSPHEGADDE